MKIHVAQSFSSLSELRVKLSAPSNFLHFAIIGLILMLLLLITGDRRVRVSFNVVFLWEKIFLLLYAVARASNEKKNKNDQFNCAMCTLSSCMPNTSAQRSFVVLHIYMYYNIQLHARVHKSFYEFELLLFFLLTFTATDSQHRSFCVSQTVKFFFLCPTRTQRSTNWMQTFVRISFHEEMFTQLTMK